MAVKEQYPPLSLLISTIQLPQFVQELVEDNIRSIHYKEYYPEKSKLGDSAVYAITLLLEKRMEKTLVADIKLVVNPAENGMSQIPMYIGYNLEIVKYIKQLAPQNFAANPRQYVTTLLEKLGIPTYQLMESVLSTYIESDDPLQTFIDTYNEEYDPSTPLARNSGFAENEYLDVAIQLANDEVDVLDILLNDYITLGSLNETKERIQDIFSEWYGDFSISDLLQKLLVPHITAGLNDLTLALEFPQKLLKPIDDNGKAIDDESSRLEFKVGGLNFDSETGLSFENQSSLSFTKSQIGNTGFTLSFTNAKVDLSRKSNIDEAAAAGYSDDFMGVYAEEAEIGLPEGWKVNEESSSAKIVGRNLLIGTGGVSGTIGLEPKNEGEANPILHCTLGEWEFGLESFSVTFEKNAITASDIHGSIHLPEKLGGSEIGVSIALSGNGDFSVTLNTQELQALNFFSENSPYFTYKMVRAVFGKDDDRYYLGTSGSISFEDGKMKDILKADIVVDNLRIWSEYKQIA